jgi:hypothetical protein
MPAVLTDSVVIDWRRSSIEADLVVRDGAVGLVVFSHGSGSSRLPPRRLICRAIRAPGRPATSSGCDYRIVFPCARTICRADAAPAASASTAAMRRSGRPSRDSVVN